MGLFWTTVSGKSAQLGGTLMTAGVGAGVNLLRSKLAGGFKDSGVKFYYDEGAGGKIVDVVARKVVGAAAAMAKDEVDKLVKNGLKKLIGGKKLDPGQTAASWLADQKELATKEENYGVNFHGVDALDDWGNKVHDAIMLAIPVSPPVSVEVSSYGGKLIKGVSLNWLVWYDVTGLVSVSSDKVLVLTQVTGRDYSRKELVSNGDIRFSISGHITSNIPDVYPSKEGQKFRQIMRYRGIVDVNNEILDQWGVSKIVIQSFSLPTSEGNKAIQDYSFECVGIQPDQEADVREDTIKVYDERESSVAASSNGKLTWKDVIKGQVEGIAQNTADLASEGLGIATGMLDGVL